MTTPTEIPTIASTSLEFLRQLRENNQRDWFSANRPSYEMAKAGLEKFVSQLLIEIEKFDNISGLSAKDCIFRINRDVRFSKNKAPYKTNLAVAVGRGGRQSKYLDYYLHLEPGQSFLGGGIYAPTGEQLGKIRQEIDYNVAEVKSIIYEPTFARYFGEVQGSKLKTTPKGYNREHPEIELLRLQQFFFMHAYTDEEVTAPDFLEKVVQGCVILKPLLAFLNYILFEEVVSEGL
ncbi:MAG: DUF2461 domain-containing protein [Bacteroidota bacterium]